MDCIVIFCHYLFNNAAYYASFVWLPTYFQNDTLRNETLNDVYVINTWALITTGAFGFLSGFLGDKLTPTKVVCIMYLFRE